jgi:hypothetical protein
LEKVALLPAVPAAAKPPPPAAAAAVASPTAAGRGLEGPFFAAAVGVGVGDAGGGGGDSVDTLLQADRDVVEAGKAAAAALAARPQVRQQRIDSFFR